MHTKSTIALNVNHVLHSKRTRTVSFKKPVLVFNSNSGYIPNRFREVFRPVLHLVN